MYGVISILAERGREVKQAIAHVWEIDKTVQSVENHLIETAEIAQALAKSWNCPKRGYFWDSCMISASILRRYR